MGGLSGPIVLPVQVRERLNVTDLGPRDAPALVLAHGFGCDQEIWRHVAQALATDHRVVLFDYLGFGRSDVSAYDGRRRDSLQAYAGDVLDVCHGLGLDRPVFVGHSVSSMIGVLAHLAEPKTFSGLVLVVPSARYVDEPTPDPGEPAYVGGFSAAEIDDLLELMETNHLGWQAPLSQLVAANGDRPELAAELESTFCQTRPDIASDLARLTFLGDNRADLARVDVPTLVVQVREDAVAPMQAGRFVHDHIRDSRLVVLEGSGHAPMLSAPEATVAAIRDFLPG